MLKTADTTYFSLSGKPSSQAVVDDWFSGLKDSLVTQYSNSVVGKIPKTASFIKYATEAQGPPDSGIESALVAIAEQKITEKVPGLMPDYWLGFQVLKKTDDDSRACGFFAFKPGDELIYIPIFSINAKLRGYEIMYIVSKDAFVPSDEKWVNQILNKKQFEPGKVVLDKDKHKGSNSVTFSQSSGMKYSGFDFRADPRKTALPDDLVRHACKELFKEASITDIMETPRYKSAMAGLSLGELLSWSAKATKTAAMWSHKYPIYGKLVNFCLDEGETVNTYLKRWEKKASIAKQYGVKPVKRGTLQEELTKAAGLFVKPKRPVGKVTLQYADEVNTSYMKVASIEELYKKGYVITDTRDQTKLASLVVNEGKGSFGTPSEPGSYEVLFPDGSWKRCLVLLETTLDSSKCHSRRYSSPKYYVVCPETHTYAKKKSEDIIVQPDSYKKKFEIPESKSDTSGPHCLSYLSSLLITPSGFAYEGALEKVSDGTWKSYGQDVLELPNTIGVHAVDKDDPNTPIVVEVGSVSRKYTDNLVIASRLHLDDILQGQTKKVKIQKRDGSGKYSVDGKPEVSSPEAVFDIMTTHSLDEDSAESLVEEVDKHAGFVSKVFKYAERVPSSDFKAEFPDWEEGEDGITGLPVKSTGEKTVNVGDNFNTAEPDPEDFDPKSLMVEQIHNDSTPPLPTQKDMESALKASETGQKEFVSSHVLMSLLRSVDDTDTIFKYTKHFEKALDSLARLYIQVLWRYTSFEERFGKNQLEDFLDDLVNLLTQMGDFIIYIKNRDIHPAPVLTTGEIDMDDAENE